MDVRVEEGRQQRAPARVDRFLIAGRLQRAGRRKLGDLPVTHAHVVPGVDARAGVEHMGSAEQQVRWDPGSLDELVGGHHARCLRRSGPSRELLDVLGAIRAVGSG